MSQKIIWLLLDFTSHLLSFGSSLSVLVLSPYLFHLCTAILVFENNLFFQFLLQFQNLSLSKNASLPMTCGMRKSKHIFTLDVVACRHYFCFLYSLFPKLHCILFNFYSWDFSFFFVLTHFLLFPVSISWEKGVGWGIREKLRPGHCFYIGFISDSI